MGCFVYLRPLVDLWRPDVQPVQQGSDPTDEHGAGPLRAAGALLGAAALLALLLAWGTGLLGLAGGLS